MRSRASRSFGGAGASIGSTKRRRLIFAAQHYLLRLNPPPPCRFDAVLIEGDGVDSLQWLRAAFDAQ